MPQRVPPSTSAHAPRRFPGLGTRLPRTPTLPILKTSCRTLISAHITLCLALTILSQTSLWHACLWLEHFLSGMSHSGFSSSPFLYPLALLQGEDHGTTVLPLIPTRVPSPTPISWTRSVFAHCTPFFMFSVVCVFPLVTCCLSCDLYCSSFVGQLNDSCSLVSSLFPSPKV